MQYTILLFILIALVFGVSVTVCLLGLLVAFYLVSFVVLGLCGWVRRLAG